MNEKIFANYPDVLDAKLLAKALCISKSGAYCLMNRPDFPTLMVGGRKLVTKQNLTVWMDSHTRKEVKPDGHGRTGKTGK